MVECTISHDSIQFEMYQIFYYNYIMVTHRKNVIVLLFDWHEENSIYDDVN
jgi:hypothetical protein